MVVVDREGDLGVVQEDRGKLVRMDGWSRWNCSG